MKKSKIFVFGYHGKHNFGDDAVCFAFLSNFCKLFDDRTVCFYVYSSNDYFSKVLLDAFPNIRTVSSFTSIIKVFIQSQAVIIDGGDHLNDYGSFRKSLKVFAFYFNLSLLSKFSLKKFVIVNGGFGTTRSFYVALLKIILKLSNYVSVRDTKSAEIAAHNDCSVDRGFDTAILMQIPSYTKIKSANLKIGISVTPVFKNFFSDCKKDANLAENIAKEIEEVMKKHSDVSIHFLVCNSDLLAGDQEIISKVLSDIKSPLKKRINLTVYDGDPIKFLRSISALDYIIGCKYHSILFSYLLEKPMIVITYHPKNLAITTEIGLPSYCAVSLEDLSLKKLSSVADALIYAPEDFMAALPISDAREKALNSIRYCARSVT